LEAFPENEIPNGKIAAPWKDDLFKVNEKNPNWDLLLLSSSTLLLHRDYFCAKGADQISTLQLHSSQPSEKPNC
jgi:hypothetical protein